MGASTCPLQIRGSRDQEDRTEDQSEGVEMPASPITEMTRESFRKETKKAASCGEVED